MGPNKTKKKIAETNEQKKNNNTFNNKNIKYNTLCNMDNHFRIHRSTDALNKVNTLFPRIAPARKKCVISYLF